MQRMLCGTENISLLLYGKPGSGKTEYAKALAKASGLKPLTQEGIRCMLDRYFHAYPFSESDIARFERRSSVMPGDFGALAGPVESSASGQNAARLAAGHYTPLPYPTTCCHQVDSTFRSGHYLFDFTLSRRPV